MNKMFIVLRHEFRQKIRSKAFIILTFIAPLLMAALIAIPILITTINQANDKTFIIIDNTGKLGKYFTADTGKRPLLTNPGGANSSQAPLGPQIHIEIRDLRSDNLSLLDSLRYLLLEKKIAGYLVIPASVITDSSATATLRMTNANDFTAQEFLSARYKDGLFAERLKINGVDPDFVKHAR